MREGAIVARGDVERAISTCPPGHCCVGGVEDALIAVATLSQLAISRLPRWPVGR